MKEGTTSTLSRSNSLFLKQFPEAAHSLDPHNHLSVLDQHLRCSGSSSFASALQERLGGTPSLQTPPLSPAESYAALYPVPPHLSREPSPASSPRRASFASLVAPPTHSLDEDDSLPTTQLMGKLSIVVVEARNLRVETGKEKPYVLLQYDRTDSVSREYGAPSNDGKPPLDAAGRGRLKRFAGRGQQGTGLDGKGTITIRRVGTPIGDKNGNNGAVGPPPLTRRSTTELTTSTRIVDDLPPIGDPKDIGTPDAPKWHHKASFDVIAPGRTILICVYDKLAPQGGFPAHGFLGASVFEPPLSADTGDDGLGLDLWVPLTSALDPSIGGEVRLRILFENLHARPKLTVDDFQVLRRIGQGSFGQVFRVRKRDTKRIYAMKVISKKNVASPEALAQVLAERQVLARTLDSPFLVALKFSFQSPTDLFFVIDYKSGGELFQHLQRDGGRFEEGKTRFYVAEIILGLAYLHAQNIVYRDLKPENCLLDGSGHVILCDFGLSKLLDSSDAMTRTLCGTTAFTAPEVLLDVGYNHRCDFWSLGCLFYEMCYGWSPFYAETRLEEYERILTGEIKIPAKKGYSPEGRDLLQRLLTRDPAQRIGTNEIQSHPFFGGIDWSELALRQVSPPFKPPTHADEDACDYHDLGRSAHWMFDESGGCHSRRGSLSTTTTNESLKDEDVDGLFRNFTFTAKERMAKQIHGAESGVRTITNVRENGSKERKTMGAEARRSSFNAMP